MTTNNQDSVLFMTKDKTDQGTLGASVGFEAKAPIIGEIEIISGDIHASRQKMYGSQISIDYENATDVQKLEGSLYILTSVASTMNPMMYEAIDAVSNELTGDLTTEYYESGAALSGGNSFNLFKVDVGPDHATVGSAKIGLGFEVGKSFRNRTYPINDYHEYLIQYVYSANTGISGSLLGNDIIEWGPSDYIDSTVILGQDRDNNLYGKLKIKDNEKPIMLDYVTKEINYDYGQINDEDIINPFETNNIQVSNVFDNFIENMDDFDQGNISVYETRGKKLVIELPLDIKVLEVQLSLNPGIRMGQANNYPLSKSNLHLQKSYNLEEYTYDDHVQNSAEELSYIITALLEPIGPVMEEVITAINEIAEKGKEILFNTGKIIFNIDTYFFTLEDQATVSSVMASSPTSQSPEITISTYSAEKPAPQTMAIFNSMGISSSYATSLSGGNFVIGNITDLQPYNISFTPAAQLTLNYTDEDVSSIDESFISIYRWDDSNNSWLMFPSIINITENTVTSNITRFGTYAIGYDTTSPTIEWNTSDLYVGNITINAIINDSGSGINISSIKLYLDDQEEPFSYNIFSGQFTSTINTSIGNHTVRIYAEDTSANSNEIEKVVESIRPTAVENVQIIYIENNKLELSWSGENGTYSIDYYKIYQNGILANETPDTNSTINDIDGIMYSIYPIDQNGNTGIGNAITYRQSRLTPQFSYDWENTVYPSMGYPITFNATDSYLICGTIETTITLYTWIFDDDYINPSSGVVIDKTFATGGLHKVTLQIEDTFNSNATITKIIDIKYPPADFNNDLYTGWNLISTPILPGDTSIASVLSPISGNYNIIWAYNASDTADHWKKYDPNAPFGNDLTTMEPGKGYWIMMTSDETLPITGTVPESIDIDLKAGWNLIGYNSLNPLPITDALTSINGNYSIVWSYSASDPTDHWKKYDPNAPFGNDLANMEPGKSYWMMMNSDDNLEI